MLTLLLALVLRLVRLLRLRSRRHAAAHAYRRSAASSPPSFHPRRKPDWVRREIFHLAALLPKPTCRLIDDIFKRRFAKSRNMTVGRTFVNTLLRAHRYAIDFERRRIKNARPKHVPKNIVWGMDLTGKTDTRGGLHSILGLIDHGTRAELGLVALANKASFTLLGHLFLAIGRYGKPKAVRTDNEAVFTSGLFRSALFLLGIRHQRIDLHCPWQNGRVERFFGTQTQPRSTGRRFAGGAQSRARRVPLLLQPRASASEPGGGNACRSVEGRQSVCQPDKGAEYWFEAWDGLLCGYYLRR